MTFNEWRHRQTGYDRRINAARSPEAKIEVMKTIALEAMKLAVERGDKIFAQQVMRWAESKRIVEA